MCTTTDVKRHKHLPTEGACAQARGGKHTEPTVADLVCRRERWDRRQAKRGTLSNGVPHDRARISGRYTTETL